jgi:hypothetical protein
MLSSALTGAAKEKGRLRLWRPRQNVYSACVLLQCRAKNGASQVNCFEYLTLVLNLQKAPHDAGGAEHQSGQEGGLKMQMRNATRSKQMQRQENKKRKDNWSDKDAQKPEIKRLKGRKEAACRCC